MFARDSQIYLLAIGSGSVTTDLHASTATALAHWLGGIETALGASEYVAGGAISLADICFVAELTLLWRERYARDVLAEVGCEPVLASTEAWPRAIAHYEELCRHEAFAPDVRPYRARLESRYGAV